MNCVALGVNEAVLVKARRPIMTVSVRVGGCGCSGTSAHSRLVRVMISGRLIIERASANRRRPLL